MRIDSRIANGRLPAASRSIASSATSMSRTLPVGSLLLTALTAAAFVGSTSKSSTADDSETRLNSSEALKPSVPLRNFAAAASFALRSSQAARIFVAQVCTALRSAGLISLNAFPPPS